MYLTLNTAGCTGTQLAPYANAAFTTNTWNPGMPFAATAALALPAGLSTLTVCFAQGSWLNFFGLQIGGAAATAQTPVAAVVPPATTTVQTGGSTGEHDKLNLHHVRLAACLDCRSLKDGLCPAR